MSSIDERVVAMKFDNAQFQTGVAGTLKSLADLNKSLKMDGASKGLNEVANATKRFSLAGIASGVENISSKFNAMSVIAVSALATIASKATQVGLHLASSLTLDPIKAGLAEYETGLNSIQTILANTESKGTTLRDVNKALAELNAYSDQTIYNFGEMARNIGTFTAAGVGLQTSTEAIKGIANLAALSGSNSQQAATAMYQLSQAIATGTVKLIDWNSVVNAGMGGEVFQNALKETARNHGVAVDAIIKKEGSFRDSLQTGWLSSKILTETLSKFTGDLSAQQLKQMGYNDQAIKAILKRAQTARDAATKIKTLTQLLGTLQESAGSGWAKTWQLIFGDIEEAKTLFTNVNNVLGGFIQSSADARNKVLEDWKKLGGRTALIDGIANAFHAVIAVVKPIREAFREIFPAVTGKQLYDLTVSLRNFTEGLKIGAGTAGKIKSVFAGFFAVLDIGWMVIKEVVSTLAELFGVATEGSGSILDMAASVGDFLVNLRNSIKQGKGLTNFFDGLSNAVEKPIRLIKKFISFIADMIGHLGEIDLSGVSAAFGKFTKALSPLKNLGDTITTAWDAVGDALVGVMKFFLPMAQQMGDFFGGISDLISKSFGDVNFDTLLSSINTGLFAALVLLFRKFINGFGKDTGGVGIFDTITGAIDGLTGTLQSMQATLRAATLLQIAAAIALLTVSVVALSKIDSEGLTKALTAISVMFTQLFVSMAVFEKATAAGGFLKMPLVTASMIALAIAVNLLAVAVKKLSELSWEELAKGLSGTIALMAALAATMKLMPPSATTISSSIGIVILAAAIRILVGAVTDLSGLSWDEMTRGLTGVAGLLVALGLYSKLSAANAGGIASGAGIILLAVGIKILASALKDISEMSWEEMAQGLAGTAVGLTLIAAALAFIPPTSLLSAAAVLVVAASLSLVADALEQMSGLSWNEMAKGLTGMGVALTAISLAIGLLPPTSLLSAAAIFVVAASLGMIADALGSMGDMTWGEIAKGLVTLAAALAIIAAAMMLMTSALPGAFALFVVSAALRVFVPVLQTLGEMSWGEIVKGLVALAGVFVVLGVAGLILTPLVPTLLGLGAAVALLGVGIALAGAGVLLFATGLTALAVAGAGASVALVAIVTGLVGLIPEVMKQIGLGLIAFAAVIATAGPAITEAITVVLLALLDSIERITPKVIQVLMKMLLLLLLNMQKYVPAMVRAGMKLITGVLNGMADNIGGVVDAAVNLVTKFIAAVGKNLPKIIQSGVDFILAFVNGLADAIRNNGAKMGEAGANLGTAIIEGMARGLTSGLSFIAGKARDVANAALNAAKEALDINSPSKKFIKIGESVNEGFAKGLTGGTREKVYDAFNDLKGLLSEAMKSSAQDIQTAKDRLEKLTKARHKDRAAIRKATEALALARKEHKATSAAYSELTKKLTDEKVKLGGLASQYEKVTEKLKKANQTLADAKKTRDDYSASIKGQFSVLPETTGETTLAKFVGDIRKQIADTKTFAVAIQKLRSLGLNDALYKELLSKGPAALPFINDVLASGKDGVNELNKLGSELAKVAGGLGAQASKNLYQAAVDSAAGLVKGLQNQQKAIAKIMDQIADQMVRSIKKKLGIKSPSKEFEKVGNWSIQGLAKGLDQTSVVAQRSAEGVGRDAIFALQKSLTGMADLVSADVNLAPTITPVLDLTAVQKEAGKLGSILGSAPLTVDAAYLTAKDASAGYNRNQELSTQNQTPVSTTEVTLIQNNNSPRALSNAEIYRQTNNQLSVAKEALSV